MYICYFDSFVLLGKFCVNFHDFSLKLENKIYEKLTEVLSFNIRNKAKHLA